MAEEEMVETADQSTEVEQQADAPEGATTEEPSNPDYQAILDAEEARIKAEEALAKDRYNASKRKREEGTDDDGDKPLTIKDLQPILKDAFSSVQKESQETRALDIARANTSSEAEAQAAVAFWKNRVVPTGNLDEDMRFAIGGLNYKKVLGQRGEVARALKNRDSVSSDSASTHFDAMQTEAPKLPANSPLKDYKYIGNNIYEKKLSSGKTMKRNARPAPGERKVWIE